MFGAMLEALTEIDRLADVLASPAERAVATGLVVLGIAVVLHRARALQRLLSRRLRPIHADIAVTLTLGLTAVVSTALVVGIWDQASEIGTIAGDLNLGGDGLARLAVSIVIFVGTYLLTRFVRRLIHDLLDPTSTFSDHQSQVTFRVSQVILWSVAIVVVLGIWIEDLSSILIGAGVLGVVIGMAAQKTLGAIVAGLVLMFSRPFEIGDWIEVQDHEGVVSEISIVNTRIQSFDGEYVVVPNDVVGSNMVINRSRRGRLRIEVEVGVDYTADVEHARSVALEAIEAMEESLSAPTPRVIARRFGDSAVVLLARYWIDRPTARRRAAARSAGVEAIRTAFAAEDIKIPFPQRELTGRRETGGFRHAAAETEPPREPAAPEGE